MTSNLNKGVSFDISISESPLRSRPIIRTNTPCRVTKTADDIKEKLELASERREDVISDIKKRNSDIYQRAKLTAEKTKQTKNDKAFEILECLEMDIALKAKRREQILEAKINSAKKDISKVENIVDQKSFIEDVSNKENTDINNLESGILMKLKVASDRRSQGLEDTKMKNAELVRRALEVAEKEKLRREEHQTRIRQSLERDIAEKAERRDELLKAKIETVKKQVEKGAEVRTRKSLTNVLQY